MRDECVSEEITSEEVSSSHPFSARKTKPKITNLIELAGCQNQNRITQCDRVSVSQLPTVGGRQFEVSATFVNVVSAAQKIASVIGSPTVIADCRLPI